MSELVINRTTDETGSQIQNGFALLELARGWLQQANSVVAEELLKSAINSGEAEKDPELRARILLRLPMLRKASLTRMPMTRITISATKGAAVFRSGLCIGPTV